MIPQCLRPNCRGTVRGRNGSQLARIRGSFGRDVWRNGAFAYGGLLIAPGGFEDDGLMFKLVLSGGLYRYNAGDLGSQVVIGSEMTGQILPGWRIKRGGIEAKIFLGLDIERHSLTPDDPANKLAGMPTWERVLPSISGVSRPNVR